MAEAKYQEAGKVYNTDVVLTSLKKVRAARSADAAAAAAEKAKHDAEAKKAADFQRLSEGASRPWNRSSTTRRSSCSTTPTGSSRAT